MQKKYILYGTVGCHLCDEAEAIISAVQKNQNIIYIKKDIAEDDELLQRFGLRIPVLECTLTDKQINWPFNNESIKEFINQ